LSSSLNLGQYKTEAILNLLSIIDGVSGIEDVLIITLGIVLACCSGAKGWASAWFLPLMVFPRLRANAEAIVEF